MSISITEAHRRYIDYHCFGNKFNTSIEMMAEIIHLYSDRLTEWQTEATDDNNEYKFDDSEFDDWKADGEEGAKDEAGYENSTGDKALRWTRVGSDGIQAAGSAIGAGCSIDSFVAGKAAKEAAKAAKEAAKEAAKAAADEAADEAAKKAATDAAKAAADEAGTKAAEAGTKAIGFIIGCTLGAATAALYWIKKPNQQAKEACDVLKNELLPEQQEILAQTQEEMEDMAENIEEASDEAATANENANQTMITNKVEYDLYAAIRASLEAKVGRGESLTAGEKALYRKASAGMVNAGETITATQESNQDTVGGIYDDIASYQEGYDLAAENMANTQGITDYAEGLDESTRTMCYIEAGVQGLNAISSGVAAVDATLFAFSFIAANWWALIFAAMGTAAAYFSGKGAAEQYNWAKDIGDEISIRESVQGFNTELTGNYEESVAVYEGAMSDIEGLEMTVPTDVEAPTNMDISQPEPPKTDPNSKDKDKDQK